MVLILLLFSFLIGVSFGSFVSAVSHRLHVGGSFVFDRSKCPHCQNILTWRELIPLVSIVIQGGKCKQCGESISWQYFWLEFVTGVLFVVVSYFLGGQEFLMTGDYILLIDVVLYWIFTFFLVLIFVYDLRHFLILNKVLLWFGLFAFSGVLLWNFDSILWHVLGSVFFGGFFWLLFALSKGRWLGGGDVKMAFVLGLLFGFPTVLSVFFLSFVGGSVVILVLMLFGKKQFGSQIPFGTFLAVAAYISFFVGENLIDWYVGLLGL